VTSPDPLALDRQVCFALAAASRSVVALYRPVLEPLGLTHPQYLVISDALYLEPATLSPLLKRLESAGLITRRRGVTDERSLSVELTPAGRALRERAERVPEQILTLLQMDLERLESTRDALTELLDASSRARRVPARA
jgi:DNA-binding MarR family transcriptional regulator